MTIYGVALLALCYLLGKVGGTLLGLAVGVNGDVGGVGFGMLLLIFGSAALRRRGWLTPPTEGGILFWSSMYIPIIVAMAATQHVAAALTGGWLALVVGTAVTLGALFLVPLIARIGRSDDV